MPELQKHRLEIIISRRTIFSIFAVCVFTVLWLKLWPIFILFFLGVILSVTLRPLVEILNKKIPEGLSIALVACLLVVFIGLVVLVVIPPLNDQVHSLVANLPKLKINILAAIPDTNPMKNSIAHTLDGPDSPQLEDWFKRGVTVAGFAFHGIINLILVLIFSVYLLIEGSKTFRWMTDFFSENTREKINETSRDVSKVVFGYVSGQAIMSVCSFLFVFTVLTILKVPVALTMAVLSGVMDILPVLGFFLSVVPAVLLALTISPTTSIIVFAAYLFYHALENYFIAPYVYGARLQVSKLAILLSLLIAGALGGILAVIPILPIIASYPIIERIWLSRFLGNQVVARHSTDPTP